MTTPKDLNELREELLTAYEWVKSDPSRQNQVKEMVNAAGKIIALTKLQIEYAYVRGEEPDVPFVGHKTGKPLKPSARLVT